MKLRALVAAVLVFAFAVTGCSITFTRHDFAHLRFLEGRWKGVGPDGAAFYEEYDFPAADTLRSRRYTDPHFSEPSDSSTVKLEAGQVVSRWGEYTWKAMQITSTKACFDPLEAPSSFCWERVGDSSVAVTQRWTDESGKAQTYTVPLELLAQ